MKRILSVIFALMLVFTMTAVSLLHKASAQSSEVWVDDSFTPATPGWGVTHFNNIQDGINAVVSSGTVYVGEGIYNENLVINNKAITLLGGYSSDTWLREDWSSVSIINGGGVDRVIYILFGDGTVIDGFEIMGGNTSDNGGGIFIDESEVSVSHNNIRHNSASHGGGISSNDLGTQSTIENNLIHHNTGTGPADVFAVGGEGTIIHYDGNTWSTMTSPTSETLNDVWGSSSNNVFAVGYSGTILRYDGNTWSTMTSPTSETLRDVWGSSGSNVFAVGDLGTMLHYDGSTWTTLPSVTEEDLRGVWGNGPDDVFAVGSLGTILHYNGSTWNAMTSPTPTRIHYAVWGSGPDDVFTAGYDGYICHYDGSSWSSSGALGAYGLLDIWGSGPDDVFAVGGFGDSGLVHYDGNSWSTMTNPVLGVLHCVWGSRPDNVFIGADYGNILHYDGDTWNTMTSPATRGICGLWGNNTGGAVYLHTDSSILKNNQIWRNQGGGIGIYEGGPPTIEGNIIRDNVGNGIFGLEAEADIVSNRITGNTGDGILGFMHGGTIARNTILANDGWGIDIYMGEIINNIIAKNLTGGINVPYIAEVVNNTIADNQVGGGISLDPFEGPYTIVNNIIWGNTPHDLPYGTANYSDVGTGNTGGTGTITTPPMFVNPAANDYHLQPGSSCIDAGTNTGAPTEDIEGNPRPIDGDGDSVAVTDIGAYEALLTGYTLSVETVCCGSVTRSPDQATYHHGDIVTLTATGNTGWSFACWSGDLSGATNPETITMDGNKTVTAIFTQKVDCCSVKWWIVGLNLGVCALLIIVIIIRTKR